MLAMVVTFGACGKEQAAEEVAEEAVAEVEVEVSEGATKEAKADTKDNKEDSKSNKKSDEKKDDKDKKDESDQSKKDDKKADKKSSEDEKNEKKATGNVSKDASIHPAYWPEGIRCSGELPAGVWTKEHTYQINCAPYGGPQRWDTSTYDKRVDVDATTYRIYHHVVQTNRESTCPYCGATIKYDDRDNWESYDEYQYTYDSDAWWAAKNEAMSHGEEWYYEYFNAHGGPEARALSDAFYNENGWYDEELENRVGDIGAAANEYSIDKQNVNEADYYSWKLVSAVYN